MPNCKDNTMEIQPIILNVQNESSWTRYGDAVTTGVPIPYDWALYTTDSLQLNNSRSERIESQISPLAWWDDCQRVKWVLVHFDADVRAKTENIYKLLYKKKGKVEKQFELSHELAITARDVLTIDSGKWRWSFRKGKSPLKEMAVYTNGKWHELVQNKPRFSMTSKARKYILGGIEEMKLEDNGPLRSVVTVRGKYVAESNLKLESGFGYELRIEIRRNETSVILKHSLIRLQGKGELDDLSLIVPVDAKYEMGDTEGNTLVVPYLEEKKSFGIVQDSEAGYWLGDVEQAGAKNWKEGTSTWWISAMTDTFMITASIKYFRERYPKSLKAKHDGFVLGLLPNDSETKDSFVPASQTVNKYELREGEARTHEIYLDYSMLEDAQNRFGKVASFHRPLLAMASPEWYTGSGVLGDLIPRNEKYEAYEEAADLSLARFLQRRADLKLFGDRNYGDDEYGKPGTWNNGEYDYLHVGMLHFLRGAGRSWYDDIVVPYASHFIDIDMCHCGEGEGRIYQHSERHNSEDPKLGSHAWIRGLLEYYCFSGDYQARDAAKKIATEWSEEILAKGVGEGTERGITWPVISMLSMYHTFREERYLKAAKVLIETVIACHDPVEGHFVGTMDRPTTKDHWGTFVIGSPVLESLVMYYQTTGDERVKNVVVQAAKRLARLNWLDEIGAWEYTHSMLSGEERIHNAKTDKMVTPAVLYGFLYSGDDELFDKAIRAFKYSEGIPAKNGKDLGQTYCFGVRIPALIEQAKVMVEKSLQE